MRAGKTISPVQAETSHVTFAGHINDESVINHANFVTISRNCRLVQQQNNMHLNRHQCFVKLSSAPALRFQG